MPGLYIHIPFCVRKCLYCDFFSIETAKGPPSQRLAAGTEDHPAFLDALERELSALPDDFAPSSVFIGGGTPTELSDHDFDRLLDMIHGRVDRRRVREWTCEANPGTLTRAKAARLKQAGVNRVSLGAQSFNARNLEFLGRIHTGDDAIAGYELLRETGFDNINIDLIYGVPGSGIETWGADVDRVIALGPEHVACYCLMFEEGTPLTRMRDRGYVREVGDDEELDQYRSARDRLERAGYRQYEISNFARPGRESEHNRLYWSHGEYIGCGPSAHSHWAGARYGNVRSIRRYCDAWLNGGSARDFEERLEPEARAREALVMWLRQLDGVPRDEFSSVTGYDYEQLCGQQIREFTAMGYIAFDGARLRLTERGLFVSDRIFSELL